MEQHEESQGADYPRGRGYGHDYMRGGEVFGGYGYSRRDEYDRPRGETQHRAVEASGGDALAPDGGEERFPQDGLAGDWDIPHDLDGAADRARSGAPPSDAPEVNAGAPRAPAETADTSAPVPQIEHTFGDPSASRRLSRSYYVTQAQLQGRQYGPPSERKKG